MLDRLELQEDDSDRTPKARDTSAGKFLRTELHRGSSEMDVKRHSIQPINCTPPDAQKLDGSPKIPKRKQSRSKYSLLRAFGGRRSEDDSKSTLGRSGPLASKSTLGRSNSSASTMSKIKSQHNTLLRKLSHRKSTASSLATVELSNPFDADGQDISDYSYYDDTITMSGPPTPTLTPTLSSFRDDNLVLCPQISITPESASVNSGVCTLWTAVEITGVLRRADGTSTLDDAGRTYSTQNLTPRCLGRLFSRYVFNQKGFY